MRAVIAGATGLVGSELLKKLLSDSKFSHVIAITRRPLSVQHEKLHEVIIPDFTQLSQHADELKGTYYFCCIGTTMKTAGNQANFRKIDYDAVYSFGSIAQANQAESFTLISAAGANASSFIFYNRVKGQIENSLIKLKLKKLVIFRPGLLIGKRTEFRAGEKIMISTLEMIDNFLPNFIKKRIMTKVDILVETILLECKKDDKAIKIYEANEI